MPFNADERAGKLGEVFAFFTCGRPGRRLPAALVSVDFNGKTRRGYHGSMGRREPMVRLALAGSIDIYRDITR